MLAGAIAGLRLHRKGANRTPPTRCPAFPRAAATGPPRRPGISVPGSSRGRMNKPAGGEGLRRDDRVFGGAHAPRLSLYRHRRRRRGGRRGGPGAADRADESGRLDHRGGRTDRGRSRADRRRADHQGVLALEADLHLPSHQERDRARRRRSTSPACPIRSRIQERVKQGHDQWLVVIGICTHLGCIPLAHQGEYDGWFCPCHGSQYDTSGRIRKGPAPKNLSLPPYKFVSDTKIQIG